MVCMYVLICIPVYRIYKYIHIYIYITIFIPYSIACSTMIVSQGFSPSKCESPKHRAPGCASAERSGEPTCRWSSECPLILLSSHPNLKPQNSVEIWRYQNPVIFWVKKTCPSWNPPKKGCLSLSVTPHAPSKDHETLVPCALGS